MDFPIYEKGARVGTLQLSTQGLYTVFAAKIPPITPVGADSICPRCVTGDEQSGRLIAAPTERRDASQTSAHALSRLWFLGQDGSAADLGLLEPGKEGRSLFRRLSRLACSRLPKTPVRAVVLPAGEKPIRPEKEQSGQPQVAPAASKPGSRTPSSERTWYHLTDGSLADPKRRLLALPWGGGELPRLARKIKVNGVDYLVFRY